jgi:hypothetical protein
MYRIRFEGGLSTDEQAAINAIVPDRLNRAVAYGMNVGDALIIRWFGAAAASGGETSAAFQAARKKMDDYVNRKCRVLSFVKKPYNATVDSALVEQGDLAQVMRSCFHGQDGFVPSGLRIYVLGSGLINQDADEQFNTVAHEISHRVLGSVDYVYGMKKALKLATNDSATAINCAENWGYFYMEVMKRMPA